MPFSFVLLFYSSAVIELPDWMGLAGLPWLFTAVQMHLHWGSGGPSHGGSEHTINGLSADAEVCLKSCDLSKVEATGVIVVVFQGQDFIQRDVCLM